MHFEKIHASADAPRHFAAHALEQSAHFTHGLPAEIGEAFANARDRRIPGLCATPDEQAHEKGTAGDGQQRAERTRALAFV